MVVETLPMTRVHHHLHKSRVLLTIFAIIKFSSIEPLKHTRNEKYLIHSTIIPSLRATWISKDAKFFIEMNNFGLVGYF